MSKFPFFNRSNTIHSEASRKPYHHLDQNHLDRSGSLSKFYGSMESVKSAGNSIRGRVVKKLCNLFESSSKESSKSSPSQSSSEEPVRSSKSSTKPGSEPVLSSKSSTKPGSEPVRSSKSSSKPGSEPFTLFRLSNAEDRVVVYLTSLRGIRRTFEDCNAVRMILKGFRIWVDERDVSMDRDYRKELQCVLGEENVALPQVFVKGKYVGGANVIKDLFECGELGRVLEGIPKAKPGFVCETCGDVRFMPCDNCSGSKKVFDEDEGLLKRCLECNENGLIRCPSCCY